MAELFDLILHSKPIQIVLSMIIVTVIGTIIFVITERRLRKMKKSDEDLLFDRARSLSCSEYDIFVQSGKKWNFSEMKIEHDFKNYLLKNEIPFYVRDFLKEQRTEEERQRRDE